MALVEAAPAELSLAHHLDQIQAAVQESIDAVNRLNPYPEPPSTARVNSSLMDRAMNIEEDAHNLALRLNALVNRAGAAI